MTGEVLLAGDRLGICPACNGVVATIGNGQIFRCIDCKGIYRIIDGGPQENMLIVEFIRPKETEREKEKV